MASARQLISRILPKRVRDLLWYARSPDLRLATAAASRLKAKNGCLVVSGPFKGMKYVATSFGSTYPPKLLGTYELELHDLFARLDTNAYDNIVDIGAAEGYYTVGLARHFPRARVTGYEMQTAAHATLRELAEMNRCSERVQIKGTCTLELLQADITGGARTLLISDCEGAESFLLDPKSIPELSHADLLVETHDFLVPGVTDLLRDRFTLTHAISTIECQQRGLADWPECAAFIPEKQRLAAMAEHRGPGQAWLWMRAKSPTA